MFYRILVNCLKLQLLMYWNFTNKKKTPVHIGRRVRQTGRQTDHSVLQTISQLDSRGDLFKWPDTPKPRPAETPSYLQESNEALWIQRVCVCVCKMGVLLAGWQLSQVYHDNGRTSASTNGHRPADSHKHTCTHTHKNEHFFQPIGVFTRRWQLTDRWKSLKVHWSVVCVLGLWIKCC